jgi:hypothetical protein
MADPCLGKIQVEILEALLDRKNTRFYPFMADTCKIQVEILEALYDFFMTGAMETLGSFNAAFEEFLGRIPVTSYKHIENYMTSTTIPSAGKSADSCPCIP